MIDDKERLPEGCFALWLIASHHAPDFYTVWYADGTRARFGQSAHTGDVTHAVLESIRGGTGRVRRRSHYEMGREVDSFNVGGLNALVDFPIVPTPTARDELCTVCEVRKRMYSNRCHLCVVWGAP